jgi:ethanolamine ammonia-lyase small subunit
MSSAWLPSRRYTEDTENFLKRPNIGRILTDDAVSLIRKKCVQKPQVQIVVSEGLSASAIEANLQDVYPTLLDSLRSHGLTRGTPIFVKGSQVKCMDHISEIL